MARGIFQRRAPAEWLMLSNAIKHYLQDITPTKKQSTQTAEHAKARKLDSALGITTWPRSHLILSIPIVTPNSQRACLAIPCDCNLPAIAIKEWRVGLWANS